MWWRYRDQARTATASVVSGMISEELDCVRLVGKAITCDVRPMPNVNERSTHTSSRSISFALSADAIVCLSRSTRMSYVPLAAGICNATDCLRPPQSPYAVLSITLTSIYLTLRRYNFLLLIYFFQKKFFFYNISTKTKKKEFLSVTLYVFNILKQVFFSRSTVNSLLEIIFIRFSIKFEKVVKFLSSQSKYCYHSPL